MNDMKRRATKRRVIKEPAALMEQLLPGAEHYSSPPPSSWKAWSRPTNPEPIDDAVSALIKKKRAPCLRPRADFAAEGIVCPYWYARAGVVSAITRAGLVTKEAQSFRRDFADKRDKLDLLGKLNSSYHRKFGEN